MKKHLLFLTLAAVLSLLPFGARAQETLTVCDSTATDSHVPYYGFDGDYVQHNQMLYPASMLTDLANSNISSIAFYLSSSPSNAWTAQFTVRMMEVTNTSMPSTAAHIDVAGAEVVYTGTFNIESGVATLLFDDPFLYNDGNLLIDIQTPAANWSSATFYGVSTSSSMSCYQYSTYSVNNLSFLPKITFTYESASSEPTCKKPRNLQLADVGATTVHLTWNMPSTTNALDIVNFGYAYGSAEDFENGTETSSTIDTNDIVLQGLEPDSTYTFYVWTNCAGTNSDSLTVTFHTRGLPVAEFPYTTGFEANDDQAWDLLNGTNTNKWCIGSAVHNGLGSMRALYISSDSGATHSYTLGSAAMVYATRDILVEQEGDYVISYDWIANGESTYDYMRVALVPSTVALAAASSVPSGFSTTGLPASWIALDGGSKLNLVTTWQHKDNIVSLMPGTYQLTFAWRNDGSGGTTPPAAIDNVHVSRITCTAPDNLAFNTIRVDGFNMTWHPRGEETQWAVKIGDNEEIIVDNPFYHFVDGEAETGYAVSVRAICEEGDTSFALTGNISTPHYNPVTVFPYTNGFEENDDNSWTIINGSLPNKWYIGNAANNGGSSSLYISSNNGEDNQYNETSASLVYATRTLEIADSDDYLFSFDWRANGESTWDFLRAVLVPVNVTLAAADALPTGLDAATVPAGWIAVDGGSKLNLKGSWQTSEKVVPLNTGTYQLAFVWRNDGSVGSQPPAAVDNLLIKKVTCPAPDSLHLDSASITTTAIGIEWNVKGNEEAWQYRVDGGEWNMMTTNPYVISGLLPSHSYSIDVRAYCGVNDESVAIRTLGNTGCDVIATSSLPFIEQFENMIVLSDCWTTINPDTINPNDLGLVSMNGNPDGSTPAKGVRLHAAAGKSHYIAMPEAESLTGLAISFYAARPAADSLTLFEVGVMSDLEDTTTFESIAVLRPAPSYEYFNKSLASYTGNGKYVTFHSNGAGTIYIDDIQLMAAPDCAFPTGINVHDITGTTAILHIDDTTLGNNYHILVYHNQDTVYDGMATDTTFTIQGLVPATAYVVEAKALCTGFEYPRQMVGFVSACVPLEAEDLPYAQDFSGYTTSNFHPCWHKTATYPSLSSAQTDGTSKFFTFYNYSTSSYPLNYLAMPELASDVAINTLEVSFDVHRSTTASYQSRLLIVAVDTAGFAPDMDYDTLAVLDINNNNWDNVYVSFDQYTGNKNRIVFVTTYESTTNYVYIRDIDLHTIPTCRAPRSIVNTYRGADSVSLTWTGTVDNYGYEYGPVGFELGEGIDGTTDTNILGLSELASGTTYDFYLWGICGENSDTIMSRFTTKAMPVTELPYSTGFEAGDDVAWDIDNGNLSNQWHIGNATHNGTGNSSLYISKDNGSTNSYNTSYSATVFAYRAIDIAEPGDYTISFDWNVNGESSFDYLRAFLIPDTTVIVASSSVPSGYSSTTNPESWLPLTNRLNLVSGWQHHDTTISVMETGLYKLTFVWRNDGSSGTQPPAAVDNIVFDKLPCSAPINFQITSLEPENISIAWTPVSNEASWKLVVDTNIYIVTGDPMFDIAAEPGHDYSIALMAICDEDTSGANSYMVHAPNATPATVPYSTGFEEEDDVAWETLNGSFPNKWIIDTAAYYGTEEFGHSLYISNDSGATNAYTISTAEVVYTYRTINITEEGDYIVGFDWRANGEGTYDYLRAAIVSSSETLVPSSDKPTDFSETSLPNGWIAVDGGSKLNLVNEWTRRETEVSLSAGFYNIVFAWRNDASMGSNPPAAIDNVSVSVVSCTRPKNLQVSDITQTSATIAWEVRGEETQWEYRLNNGEWVSIFENPYTIDGLIPSSQYTVQLRARCSDDDSSTAISANVFYTQCGPIDMLPFTEDFEGYSTGQSASFHPCWSKGFIGSGTSIYPYVTSASNNKYMYFYTYSTSYTMNYLILPELDASIPLNTLEVSFDAHKYVSSYSTYPARLIVAAVNSATFTVSTTFDTLAEFNFTNDNFETFYVDLSEYAGTANRIAFIAPYTGSTGYVYLDNIDLHPAPTCRAVSNMTVSNVTESSANVSWTAVEGQTQWLVYVNGQEVAIATDTTYSITDLDASTDYTVAVRAFCGGVDTARAVSASFSTPCASLTLPWSENFDGWTAFGECWSRYSGAFPTTGSTTTSGWGVQSSYGDIEIDSTAIAMNVYSTYKYWAVSPAINVTADQLTLTFDIAGETWSSTASTFDDDDVFIVAVSTDNSTWTTVYELSAETTADGLLTDLTSTYDTRTVAINGYNGQTIYIAFYGASGATGGDNRLVIDNISLVAGSGPGPQPQNCDAPVVTSAIADGNTITLSWTGAAAQYQVASTQGAWTNPNPEAVVNATTYTFENLSAGSYTVGVRAVCEDGGFSAWATRSVTVSGGEGIDDVDGLVLALFPNPAAEQVTLQLGEASEVSLVDQSGRTAGRYSLDAGTSVLDLSQYASGVYYVRVVSTSGTSVRKLVVK